MSEEETMEQVGLIVGSISLPMTMKAAVELGILEMIAANQMTAVEVAEKLLERTDPQAGEMVERILRLLAAFSVVSCSVEVDNGGTRRVYGLTSVGRYFVKNEDGVSMSPLLSTMTDKVAYESWRKLKDAVIEGGIAFNKAHKMNIFEYQAVDPIFNEAFNAAMFNHTTIQMKKILESYNGFTGINKIVDVGGGLGYNLKIILSKYPNMQGICFDLPHVVKHGINHLGIKHMGGDMFQLIPHAEVIFTKWILHDWDDEDCIKLLKNCYNAIPTNGKVIVVESIISDVPETTNAAKLDYIMDLTMMTQTVRGKERTKKEFITLANQAGFTNIIFACRIFNLWVMEFHK